MFSPSVPGSIEGWMIGLVESRVTAGSFARASSSGKDSNEAVP